MIKMKKENKRVTFELSANIKDKKHIYFLNQLLQKGQIADALAYINSFNAKKRANRIYQVSELKYTLKQNNKEDALAVKGSGFYLKQMMSIFDPDKSHKPTEMELGKWIGVEIECFIPYNKALKVFRMNGIDVDIDSDTYDCGGDYSDECSENGCHGEHERDSNYSENSFRKSLGELFREKKIRRVSIKDDGSIRADDDCFGVEFTCLITQKDRSSLIQLCDMLKLLGARVNKSCGMHVHLDQRDLVDQDSGYVNSPKLMKRGRNFKNVLNVLAMMVPHSRRTNSFCRLIMNRVKSGSRYAAINMAAFKRFQTIEIRLHSATTDFNKINNWIDLLILIQNSDRKNYSVDSFDEFCFELNVPEKLIEYMESRIAEFQSETAIEVSAAA